MPRAEIEAALLAKLDAEEPGSPKPSAVRKVAEPTPVPKAAEVLKPTGAEKEQPSVTPSAESPPVPSVPLGAEAAAESGTTSPASAETEHAAIKRQISRQAEALGYYVVEEEFVPGSLGRADLVLRRGKRAVVCEVSVTTNAEDEIGYLNKCLAGGYPQVVLVATSTRKLADIERRFRKTAAADGLAKVSFRQPADLIEQLRAWAATDPRDMAAEKAVPHKQPINLESSQMTDAERGARERAMLAGLAQAMKAPPPG